jgi:hypothetical protein
MDRYTQFGLRGDADEQIRRAVRDGFKRAGLSHAQMTQAMDWYKDHVRPGMDETKLTESFAEFAAAKNWGTEQRDAAVSVYGQVRDQGPAAVMSPAPELQQQHRDAIERMQTAEAPAFVEQPAAAPADPGQAAVPGPADGGAVRV